VPCFRDRSVPRPAVVGVAGAGASFKGGGQKDHASVHAIDEVWKEEDPFLSNRCHRFSFASDGRFIEQVGTYNPRKDPAEVTFKEEKAFSGEERRTTNTDSSPVID